MTDLETLLNNKFQLVTVIDGETVTLDCGVFAVHRETEGELGRVIAYAQQDARWRGDKMGGVAQTIGAYGCAMVCASMVYTQIDSRMTPSIFNGTLTIEGGYNVIYNAEAHLAWDRLPDIFPRFKWLGRKSWKRFLDAGELAEIFAMIDDAPLPLWVDFRPERSGIQTHFVLAVDHSADDIEIIDPWEGVGGSLLDRYGKDTGASLNRAIWGYRQLVVE